ncbi:MAG: TIGR01459 family HAD-type hydrolase [Roseitalea sp.]|jgi:HAD superfamily hydrolase (TIGR01459 family)|nr:TIGR01459 family HAD-type hydrolase [Roseitalea sp.]MBO6723240.1 TIGR01459 family HAD-type hydrolase [Roseitalea sp.]MBO6744414.1 TIGR01459 family HAD-type hydrolase [Roseitalea sp.]
MAVASIDTLDVLHDAYDAILCDVWGVLHNGVMAWPAACAALERARAAGKTVILITNSPRPTAQVLQQLARLGVPEPAHDDIVTSGDVTRTLIADGPRRIFHIGTEDDLPIFDDIDVELVEDFEASAIVVTGPRDDERETPDDYAELLARLRARDLPMICANPDIVVERGDRLVYCAGAIARAYGLLGGRTLIAGKPHTPIYEAALGKIGPSVDRTRILAIGDGMTTDVKGAMDNGFDLLFVSDGIHAREYGEPGAPDPGRLNAVLRDFGAAPVATMTNLR